MLDLNKLSSDITEVVARTILFKDRQAEGNWVMGPQTEDWAELYRGDVPDYARAKFSNSPMTFNRYRAEVDSVVANIMFAVQKAEDDRGAGQ